MAVNNTYNVDGRVVSVAQQLENEGKITHAACIAALNGDEDTYSEEMINAAQKVIRGQTPHFLSKSEIKALADQRNNQQLEPVRRDNTDEKLFFAGAKWLFLHATGLAIPYAVYKVADAIDKNKKSLAGGAVAGLAIAAFVGLDDIS